LGPDHLGRIVVLKLMKLGKRLMERHKLAFAVAPDVVQQIVRLCTVAQSGARNIDNILDQRLMPEISRQLLAGMAEGKAYTHLFVSGDGNEGFGLNFSEGDFVMPENTAEEDMVEEAMADASKAAETTA
jgi:type VI secretion system protein VasG